MTVKGTAYSTMDSPKGTIYSARRTKYLYIAIVQG